MKEVYAKEVFPTTVSRSVFLAGPTPRSDSVNSWRDNAIGILSRLGFSDKYDTAYIPEPRYGWNGVYYDQIEWEEEALNRADCIVFWVPRDIVGKMPAFTTNDEWGYWKDSGKVVFGAPDNAEKVRYQKYYANKYGVPVTDTLEDTLKESLKMIGNPSIRNDGECQVPMYIWNKPEFKEWYGAQKSVGNRLDGARISWTFKVPPPAFGYDRPPQYLLMYALHANVHVAAEHRNKKNEIVLFRTNISSILMHDNNRVLLVKEFKSPCHNKKCIVYELPGGSTIKPGENPLEVAAQEVEEEVGLKLDKDRFVRQKTRQLASTLSAHTCTLFSVKLSKPEMDYLAEDKTMHGAGDEEQIHLEVRTIKDIFEYNLLDWSNIGMIMSAIAD